jgi:hypothetical protein
MLSITPDDILQYFHEINVLKKESGFEKLLPSCDFHKQAVRNYQDAVLKMSAEFMQERSKEE